MEGGLGPFLKPLCSVSRAEWLPGLDWLTGAQDGGCRAVMGTRPSPSSAAMRLVCLYVLLLRVVTVDGLVLMHGRIIGGYAAVPNSIRYIVSLQSTRGQHFCGGSLVHRYWVLTAAHCNIGLEHMMIVAGDYTVNTFEGTEQYAKPHRLVTHPLYNPSTNNADVMLIKLRAPMVLNGYVALAPLPRQGTGVVEGRVCRVSGWGHSSLGGGQAPFTLRTVAVPIVSAARCNSSESFAGNITSNMICAGYRTGGRDACKVHGEMLSRLALAPRPCECYRSNPLIFGTTSDAFGNNNKFPTAPAFIPRLYQIAQGPLSSSYIRGKQ
ncbi:trypsin-like isoform X2 [Betta splendens]|uniref:trypsin n=1 Tax=Betta splendens TaxID=158456 RepID=A0A6P7MIL2_BETSP|nr:trypsin-like isoform X2 [Betta splendens]